MFFSIWEISMTYCSCYKSGEVSELKMVSRADTFSLSHRNTAYSLTKNLQTLEEFITFTELLLFC